MFDGTELRLYKPVDVRNNLSGNLIDNIMEAEDHVLWIQTNYGLDRFDTHLQTVQRFKDFQDISCMAKRGRMMSWSLRMTVIFIILIGKDLNSTV